MVICTCTTMQPTSLEQSFCNDWLGSRSNYILNTPMQAFFPPTCSTPLNLMPGRTTKILNQRTRPRNFFFFLAACSTGSLLLLPLFNKKVTISDTFLQCKCLNTSELVGIVVFPVLPGPAFSRPTLERKLDRVEIILRGPSSSKSS
ncbi:hypothetical protein L873DRAFT_436108 [Choiromyces venosus 120613-1]|uniref:Uncharacterized protein n=1 Tax=Choiromyces venosus 120613-1 TaxID=1336337 RepID=A0A3N4IW79_9PEZI|nr:hypothetical protein L873DRAFT_436108 [Choiromyces venosus 120613-1]